MIKFLLNLILSESATSLSITRKTSGTIITAAGFNTNYTEIETVVNGNIDSDSNIVADGVKAVALNSDVVNTDNGLKQEANGSLSVDPSDTTPGLEITDGGLRAKVYGMLNRTSNGIEWGRAGDVVFSSSTTTPDGFTDISTTYSNKFIRINTTALSAGGADTHTHGVGSYTVPAHDHDGVTGGVQASSTGSLFAGALDTQHAHSIATEAATAITGTSASGDNVPAYVTLKAYQKN